MTRSPGTPWRSLSAVGASVALMVLTAALGPSAAVPPLPGRRLGPLPPYAASAGPAAELVTALLAAAVLLGAAGLLGASRALARGWQPDPRRLVAAGALAAAALAVLPPIGSADPKSYAAYGRMAATGYDPYSTTPRQLAGKGDPVGAAVEPPWQDSPSVYGPVATAEEALVAFVAGDSTLAAVGLLGLLNAGAFLLAGLILQRLSDPARRCRAALLWSLNPLVLQQVVAGAHLDALVVLAVVLALVTADSGRYGLAGGLAGGVAAAIKLPGGAVLLGLAWVERRSRPRLLRLTAGFAASVAGGYVAAGPHALDQVRRASRFVSRATPWRPLTEYLDGRYGVGPSRSIVGIAALGVAGVLTLVLLRSLPQPDPAPPWIAARVTLAVSLAYLLAAPYALPWYDATAWALLALLPASTFDVLLLAHTTVLSLAYLPGRDTPLPTALTTVTSAVRNDIAPYLLLGVVFATLVAGRRTVRGYHS